LSYLFSRFLIVVMSFFILGVSVSAEKKEDFPYEELNNFIEVYSTIRNYYVDDKKGPELLDNAIKGMVSELDPHSDYLPKKSFVELGEQATGQFGGLGIEVEKNDAGIKVIAPIEDSPAALAGIRAGDIVLTVDGTLLKGLSLTEAVELMRGEVGSEVKLSVYRESEDASLSFQFKRDIVKVSSVKVKKYKDNVIYIRLSKFQSNSFSELKKKVSELYIKSSDVKGFILDLRNNPGGVINSAVDVVGFFRGAGLVTYTEGRSTARRNYSYDSDSEYKNTPLVVLINEGSASASEIVSGALQDYHHSVIVGRKSFGKGTVQSMIPFDNGAGVKITTARYYLPSGRTIQNEGVIPDVIIPELKVKEVQGFKDYAGEASYSNSVKAKASAVKDSKSLDKAADEKILTTPDPEKDFELFSAYNVLKSLMAIKRKDS